MQTIADQKAAVIIHKSHQIQPAVLPLEHEREQIGLPQLIGPGTLEAPHLLRMRAGDALFQLVTGFVQHPGHRRRTGRQGWTAEQFIADPLAAPIQMQFLEHHDRALSHFRQLAPWREAARPFRQTGRSLLHKPLLPQIQRVLR